VFLADSGGLRAIALSGTDAPGIISGTFVEFDLPSLNNLDDVVFLATVRRGRETLPVLYLWSNGRLRKLVAAGDLVPGGGTFAQFGVPAINNKGLVAFPATVERGKVLGGLFLAGTVSTRLFVGAGETAPNGAMLTRFPSVSRRATPTRSPSAHISVRGGGRKACSPPIRSPGSRRSQSSATRRPAAAALPASARGRRSQPTARSPSWPGSTKGPARSAFMSPARAVSPTSQ
jgi:hypothetical protein